MPRSTLFSRFRGPVASRTVKKAHRRRWFERLEDRRVLAYDVVLAAGVLTLTETGGPDDSALQLQFNSGTDTYEFSDAGVQFDQDTGAGSAVAGNSLSVPTAGITSIVLNLGTGNDVFTINGPAITTLAPINVSAATVASAIDSAVTLAAGDVQFTTTGTLAVNATLTATTGNVALSASATTLGDGIDLTATAGSVSITGPLTIGTAGTNTITAGTTVTLPTTDDGAGTGSLTISAPTNTATLAAIDIDGTLTVSATTINANGSLNAAAGIDLMGATNLATNVALTSSTGNVAVATGPLTLGNGGTNVVTATSGSVNLVGVVDGAGTASLSAIAGTSVTLAAVTIDGVLSANSPIININADSAAATGFSLTGAVNLATDVDLTSSTGNVTVTTGPITLGDGGTNVIAATAGTVDLANVVDGAGTASLTANAGTSVTLAAVTIDGTLSSTSALININGDASATSGINLTGAVNLATDVDLTSTTGNVTVTTGPLTIGATGTNIITAGTTVSLPSTGDAAGDGSLTINATTAATLADIDIDGVLSVTAATINANGAIQADDGITLTGVVILANNVNLTSLNASVAVVTGPLTIGTAGTNTITAGTTVSLPDTNDAAGTGSLTVSATTIATLAAIDIDGVLTVSSATINANGTIQADGGINLTGAVNLANNINLISNAANVTVTTGPLTIGAAGTNAVNAGTTVDLPSTSGTGSLTVNATTSATLADVTISGTLGVTAPTININGDAAANAGITLAGAVNLATNVDLTSSAGNIGVTTGPVTLGNGGTNIITATTGTVSLPNTIDGAGTASLTANAGTSVTLAGVTIDGTLSSTSPIININGDAAAATGISLAGAVNVATNVDLTSSTGAVTVTTGPLTLGNAASTNIVNAGTTVNLPSTSGDASLTVTAGTSATLADVTIAGALGVTAPAININGDAAANAGISLTGAVNLAANVDLASSAGNITVATGPLTLGNGGTNVINANGAVNLANTTDGANTTSLTITAGTAMTLAGVTIDGTLGVTSPVTNVNGTASAASGISISALTNLAANVDLQASNGNVTVGGELRLLGAGGANSVIAGSDVGLAAVTDNGTGTPNTFTITAGHNITFASISLTQAPTTVAINVDENLLDGLGGNLSAGPINAGAVTIRSNSNETITANITATSGAILIELDDTAEVAGVLQNSLTIAANTTLTASGSITLNVGDDLTVNSGVKLLAGSTVTVNADFNSADPQGAAITFVFDPLDVPPGDLGQISGPTTVTINGNSQDDTLLLPVNWLTPAQTINVNMSAGNDRVTLKYPRDFSGPAGGSPTNLTIDSGTGTDFVDVDASLDLAARQVQYTYLNDQGTNVTLLTDTSDSGLVNLDSLNITINDNEKYLARGGANAADDQFVIVGQSMSSNFITIADINNGGNANPADDTVGGNKRFGVQGFEFIRAIGGNKTDGIRVDVSTGVDPITGLVDPNLNPSGALLVLIEGNGSNGALINNTPDNSFKQLTDPNTGLGERLIGSLTIPNIILGAGDNNSMLPANPADDPLIGQQGPLPEAGIGKVPSRAIIIGGNVSNLLLPDYRIQLKANSTLLQFVEINTPGSFIDVLQGSNTVTVIKGPERAGTRAGVGCGENLYIGGEPTNIDVCSWLLAKFPTDLGINQLINPMGGANALSPLARQRIENVDLSILSLSGGLPEPGGTVRGNSPQTVVTYASTIVVGHETTLFLQTVDPATGQNVPGAVFEIDINGDGSIDAQASDASGQGVHVPVTFDSAGSPVLRVTAIAPSGVAGPTYHGSVTVTRSGLIDGDLYVGGTAANDQILLLADTAGVRVRLNGQQLGPFALADNATIHVAGQAGNDLLVAGRNIHNKLNFDGGAGNDVLYGGAAGDTLLGGAGRDYLFGDAGDDFLDGGAGDDRIYGGEGNDRLQGGDGDDVLLGNAGSDQLHGQAGRDILLGGLGMDLLVGGASEDILIGGTTAHDGDEQSLLALLTAWKQNVDLASRIQSISDPNFAAALNQLTVVDDEATDSLFGEAGEDWFFMFADDLLETP